jgi:hypothetical protein
MPNENNHIMCFNELPEGNEVEDWYDGPGWYFKDMTGLLHGPFGTYEECEDISYNYIEG